MNNRKGEDRVAARCKVKCLYNHSLPDGGRRSKWSEFADPIKEEERLKALGQAFAIVHRFSPGDGKKGENPWETHSIEIQSKRLRSIIAENFKDYPDWSPAATPFTFVPPFKPIVHRWDKFLELLPQQKDIASKMEVALLRDELKPLLAPFFSVLEQLHDTRAISFDYLWLIFAPGDLVVMAEKGNLAICKLRMLKFVDRSEYSPERPPYWQLSLDQIDWNGSYCGYTSKTTTIYEFSEPQSILDLEVWPLRFAVDQTEIREKLLARGRKFASLRGFHVKTCTGKKFIISENFLGGKQEIARPFYGRVIIDTYAYYRCQNEVAPNLSRNLEGELLAKAINKPFQERPDDEIPSKREREELRPLTEMECLLAVPQVKGFDLRSKEWCKFNVADIQGPDWDNTAYDKLVLPDGEKELTMAFADRSRLRSRVFDDFVQHKGEGIIILLCGPPGVGKTLTAEAVADKSKVPLYILSASDLGTSPEKVESTLNNALE